MSVGGAGRGEAVKNDAKYQANLIMLRDRILAESKASGIPVEEIVAVLRAPLERDETEVKS